MDISRSDGHYTRGVGGKALMGWPLVEKLFFAASLSLKEEEEEIKDYLIMIIQSNCYLSLHTDKNILFHKKKILFFWDPCHMAH